MGRLAALITLLIGFVGLIALDLIAPFAAFGLILVLAAVWCWWLERHSRPSVSESPQTRAS
jgi:hypothetical protein